MPGTLPVDCLLGAMGGISRDVDPVTVCKDSSDNSTPRRVRVSQESCGPSDLQTAALDAVKQWKYRTYLLNGPPVEVETQAQVNVTLKPQWP